MKDEYVQEGGRGRSLRRLYSRRHFLTRLHHVDTNGLIKSPAQRYFDNANGRPQ